jgi:hypothetical protein
VRHGLHRRVETIRAATFPFKPFRSPCLRPCTPVVAYVSRRVNLFVTAPGVPTCEPCRTFSLLGRAELVERGWPTTTTTHRYRISRETNTFTGMCKCKSTYAAPSMTNDTDLVVSQWIAPSSVFKHHTQLSTSAYDLVMHRRLTRTASSAATVNLSSSRHGLHHDPDGRMWCRSVDWEGWARRS